MKTVVVVDGQGGRLGSQLVREIAERFPEVQLIAVGTNSRAAENMLRAGAGRAATGENAVAVTARRADVILGPLGIVVADAMLGEVTPDMAKAIGQSGAVRILLPTDKCETRIAGIGGQSMSALIGDAMEKLRDALEARA